MTALIDINIILDVLLERQPFFKDSFKVIEMAEVGEIKGYITANSITDIGYILKRGGISKDKITELIKHIIQILEITSITRSDIVKALDLNYTDLEDALQTQCAKKIKAEYIVTRNVQDFKDRHIRVVTPEEFLTISKVSS